MIIQKYNNETFPVYLNEPGYVNIGWNYQQCVFSGIFFAYRMFNDPVFLFGSTQPPTFSQRYGRGKCGDENVLSWVVSDTDPNNKYYLTIGPYGPTHVDFPDVFFYIYINNQTSNDLLLHLYKTSGTNYVYRIPPNQSQRFTINAQNG